MNGNEAYWIEMVNLGRRMRGKVKRWGDQNKQLEDTVI